jgi:hypothetical protein
MAIEKLPLEEVLRELPSALKAGDRAVLWVSPTVLMHRPGRAAVVALGNFMVKRDLDDPASAACRLLAELGEA